MSARPSGGSSRETILEAAIVVASRDGLGALTLDQVAREAGVSKGGVMYHFPTKDQLLGSLIEHFRKKVEAALMKAVAADPVAKGRWGRAILSLMLPEAMPDHPGVSIATEAGLDPFSDFRVAMMAAMVANPALLAPIREFGRELRERILAEEGDASALVPWLAIDGLFLWRAFGQIPADDPLIRRVAEALRKMTAPGGDAKPEEGGP
jgi:AcrR family transcriptional regulator